MWEPHAAARGLREGYRCRHSRGRNPLRDLLSACDPHPKIPVRETACPYKNASYPAAGSRVLSLCSPTHTPSPTVSVPGGEGETKGDRGILTRRLCWQSLISLSAGSASSFSSRARKQLALSWKVCRLGEAAGSEDSKETRPLDARTGSGQAHMALANGAGSMH